MTDFTARISNDSDPQRAATWRLVFGADEVPLRSPFSALAMLPDRGPTEVYDLDITALTAEQRTRLVLHISDCFNVTVNDVEAQLDVVGCPILAEDVTVVIERPWRWIDFDAENLDWSDDEFDDDDDNELFGFATYYGDDDDDDDEDLMP